MMAIATMHSSQINPLASQPTSPSLNPEVEKVRQFYNKYPINLSKVIPDAWARSHNLILAQRAGIKPGDYIFDGGCGVCIPAIHIAQHFPGVRIESMTLSEVEAREAEMRVRQAGLADRIRVRVGDFHNLPFPNELFDQAFFNDSLHYPNDLLQIFKESYRVLRPGGRLYSTSLFSKEPPLSDWEQQKVDEVNQVYSTFVTTQSKTAQAAHLAGFENIEVADLTGKSPTEDLRKAYLDATFPNSPIFYGDIKARKPVAVTVNKNLITRDRTNLVTQNSTQHREKIKGLYDRGQENFFNAPNESEITTQQGGLVQTNLNDDSEHFNNLYTASRSGIKPGDYILDAGCGVGGPSIDIARSIPGVIIEAINLSPVQVKRAQELVEQAGLSDRIRVRVADFHDLPFPHNIFDVTLYLESLVHSDNLLQALSEAYRVLRPGGSLYIKDFFSKEPPLSEQEQQELGRWQQLYGNQPFQVSETVKVLHYLGFEEIQAYDLSNIVNTDNFFKLMFEKHNFQHLPFFYGEIKARKPVFVARVTPSSSDTLSASKSPLPKKVGRLVYALGTVGYDFGTEARRDSFKQLMPAVEMDGTIVPANPYDARQMVDYLAENLPESKSLIWTLNQELTPVYAIEPVGEFAADIYETLQLILDGQIEPEDSEDYVEQASIPARLSDRTVTLFSGEVVPVIEVENTRGMYAWKVNYLVREALETIRAEAEAPPDEETVRQTLTSFLHRIYYDFQNLGQTDKDRALNFTATNAFQAASTFAEAVAAGMQLDSIEVVKSDFCRHDSNCWDVKLKFFDPENTRRSKKLFRFTIDVRDIMPVTLGEVHSWSVPK